MVKVIDVDLGALGVSFPVGQVGMVIAQPHLSFTHDEPFTILEEAKAHALDCIDSTFNVARACPHGADKTHFTIFPECTIPGLDGVTRIADTLNRPDWPIETVVISGVDGLTKAQFIKLLARPNTYYDEEGNSPGRMRDDQWVNCSITWAKLPNAEVHCWVQPKLAPAWVELKVNYQTMYRGRSIYLFKGAYEKSAAPYRFSSLLCYDWIGSSDNLRMWQWLLHSIDADAAVKQAILPLTWMFVVQCNPQPSHASFMQQVGPFFDQANYPNVDRSKTCLIMANVAGGKVPGKTNGYGQSAAIFAQGLFMRPDGMPTLCGGGERQRAGNPLENFRDSIFRERGACIHSFRLLNPNALPPGSAGKKYALEDPTVHPFPGIIDPRTPSGLVPAVVKWVNDELDDDARSLAVRNQGIPLSGAADEVHKVLVTALRSLTNVNLRQTMITSSPGTDKLSPDFWGEQQSGAVNHLLHTFSILGVAKYIPTLHGKSAQASITRGQEIIEVVAVIGKSHEECDKYVKEKSIVRRGALLVVSRDEDNSHWSPRSRSILDQVKPESAEYDITDPGSAIIRMGYQDALQAFQGAANDDELRGNIDDAIF